MPTTLKSVLLVMGFWMYLTVTLAPIGFFLLAAAVTGHVMADARD
jgi:hypothetical protein